MNYKEKLKEIQFLEEKNQSNFAIKFALSSSTAGFSTVVLNNQKAEAIAVSDVSTGIAIAVSDVSTGITAIVTSADTAADVVLPIGLAIVAISVLAMIVRNFICRC